MKTNQLAYGFGSTGRMAPMARSSVGVVARGQLWRTALAAAPAATQSRPRAERWDDTAGEVRERLAGWVFALAIVGSLGWLALKAFEIHSALEGLAMVARSALN